jgi:hypothetical protein
MKRIFNGDFTEIENANDASWRPTWGGFFSPPIPPTLLLLDHATLYGGTVTSKGFKTIPFS